MPLSLIRRRPPGGDSPGAVAHLATMVKTSGRSPAPAEGSDRFLVLPENRLAWTAMTRLMKRPPTARGALVYLYGPAGIGKSHLVRQFLLELRQSKAEAPTIATTASAFAADFAAASEKKRIAEWRSGFQNCRLFVCEEIQALARRPESQKVLVSLMDEILREGGQIVLTADRMPGEIAGFEPRLLSRCHGAACIRLASLKPESRLELLAHFASGRQIAATTESLRLLAEARPASPRELQSLLVQLDAAARQERNRIDVAFVRRFLKGEIEKPAITLLDIARAVARHFHVKLSELRSTTRSHGVSLPRQCGMHLGRCLTDEPLARIAAFFGRKNHTAVIHACRRTRESLREDPTLRRHLVQIRTRLGVSTEERLPDEGRE